MRIFIACVITQVILNDPKIDRILKDLQAKTV